MSNYNAKPFEVIGTRFPSRLYRAFGKRLVDIVFALMALPIALPILCVLALLATLYSGKPFYGQDRVGKNGRIYRMFKLRLTTKDENTCFEQHYHHGLDGQQDVGDEPPLTGFGRFLRSSSIEDLPQLFNVLIGDMSFIGPRPMTVSQKALYPGKAYDDLRPGITGLWQITGKSAMNLTKCAVFDYQYSRNLSLASDLAILTETAKRALHSA
ncbi:sugar transferase [Roseovarius sp. M141]|uniref:sugar transferase n=1 Tax=Roseovarius sp. M141 TaxID=2583806 RepID=UPI0020CDE7C2|nr:sugar transferase [Roseovarius sp. M141]MCQ0090532.1 sugar transferase [Roseovarius sp. M141]